MLLLTMLLDFQRQTDRPLPSNKARDTRGSDKGGAESDKSTDASLGLADASLSAAGASLKKAGTKASSTTLPDKAPLTNNLEPLIFIRSL